MRLRNALLVGHLGLFAAAFVVVASLYFVTRGSAHSAWASLSAIAGAIGAIMLAVLLARLISRPLEQIAAAARSVAAGRFDARVQTSRLDEANTLALTFNDMAEALAAYNSTSLDRLLAEQRRSEALLAAIDDGLVIVDYRGNIERVNHVAARQLGVDAEACIGRSLDDILGGDRFDERLRDYVRRQSAAAVVEPDLVLGEGDLRRVLAVTLLPFNDLIRPGLVMVLRDVTAERRFDLLRTEFVLRASHELRTPIAALGMAVELIDERKPFAVGSPEADLFDTVRDGAAHLSHLVGDLLDVSRLHGGDTLEAQPCDLAALADAAAQRFAAMAAGRDVAIDVARPTQFPPLLLDDAQFSRVFDNLLANALRHTPQSGRVRISLAHDARHVTVAVDDSGSGIPAAKRARVFEPFVQVGAEGGGAGLGLTLCREIVERHGGRIVAGVSPLGGACLTIELPASLALD